MNSVALTVKLNASNFSGGFVFGGIVSLMLAMRKAALLPDTADHSVTVRDGSGAAVGSSRATDG